MLKTTEKSKSIDNTPEKAFLFRNKFKNHYSRILYKTAGLIIAVFSFATVISGAKTSQKQWKAGHDNDSFSGKPTVFSTRDGVILADGKPFMFNMDFSWSSSFDEEFYHYWSRMGGTAHRLRMDMLLMAEKKKFRQLDIAMEKAAKYGLYTVLDLSVCSTRFTRDYLKRRPEARMLDVNGKPVRRNYPSFVDSGFRQALGKALGCLVNHVKDKPYILGYYVQDELSFHGWGGYEKASVALFRKKMLEQYGSLQEINKAWNTKYGKEDDIVPPKKPETGRSWSDWQRYRQWTYCDFLKFITGVIRAKAPQQLIISSMDFWGSPSNPTNWWNIPQCADILIRHGILYSLGYDFLLIRDIAEWSGKPGNALCMPPGFWASFIHFMHLFDSGRTGLSYVCPGGSATFGHYRGAADSDNAYRRREPGYTTAKSIIELQNILGDTYLLSKRYPPQVGLLVTDATFVITPSHAAARNVAGILELLTDLNINFRIISEHNAKPLSRFKALIVGSAASLCSEEMIREIGEFQKNGGILIAMPGCFERNEQNMPIPAKLEFMKQFGAGKNKEQNPAAVITDAGKTLLLGWNAGLAYRESWTETFDCAVNTADEDQNELMEQAFGPDRDKENRQTKTSRVPQSRQAQLKLASAIQDFLAGHNIVPYVRVAGYGQPARIYARAFTSGSKVLVAIANRMVKPGEKQKVWNWDIEKTGKGKWPKDYHSVLRNAKVSVELPVNLKGKLRAYLMPNMTPENGGIKAFPEELPVKVVNKGNMRFAEFTLPKLENWQAVVLASEYPLLAGLGLSKVNVLPGEEIRAQARIINGSTKPIPVNISLEDQDKLGVSTAPWQTEIKGAAASEHEFTLAVPTDAKPGYYCFRAVQELPDGGKIVSPKVELRICKIDTDLSSKNITSFWGDGSSGPCAELEVKLPFRGLEGKVNAELNGFSKFSAEHPRLEWKIAGQKSHKFSFPVVPPPGKNAMEVGVIRLQAEISAGKKRIFVKQDFPIRFVKGAVVYKEKRYVNPSNKTKEVKLENFICLENQFLIARFYANRNAVLHNLKVRATDQELLSPNNYPFGLVWYSWPGKKWSYAKLINQTERVGVEFVSASPAGKPVTMTAELKPGEKWLDIAYDASQCEALPEKDCKFFLMSKIGKTGFYQQNQMWIPLKSGLKKRKRHTGPLKFKAGELQGNWVTVADEKTGHLLTTFFDIPTLKSILIKDQSLFNYEIFTMDSQKSPGVVRFRLCGDKGGMEKVDEWKKYWNSRMSK
ncbi:MAG: beta-galactosidase [Victivallales bacterium]